MINLTEFYFARSVVHFDEIYREIFGRNLEVLWTPYIMGNASPPPSSYAHDKGMRAPQ